MSRVGENMPEPMITEEGIIYFPKDYNTVFKVEIIGSDYTDDVTDDVSKLEVTLAVTTEIGSCFVELEIADESDYAQKYQGGETIRVYCDFVDGSTKIFEGYIEKPEHKFAEAGSILQITGRHLSSKLLDITVTESFENKQISGTADSILNYIISQYASGFTSNNVETITDTATINWANKPFWECVVDLCNIADCDCYVDSDGDFHFFKKGSKLNTQEAAVEDDNLIENEGIGKDTTDVKNRIIVYGEEDKGLPIIYVAEDTTSQNNYNLKEKVIRDSSIKTYEDAKKRGDAELLLLKDTQNKGKVICYLMPALNPGDKIWVTIPSQKIHDKFRVVKVIHKIVESETTECIIEKERLLPQVFKERMTKELQLEKIENPFKNKYSYIFTFDDTSQIDTITGADVSGGKLVYLSSPSITESKSQDSPVVISEFCVRVIGQDLSVSTFMISADNGVSWSDEYSFNSDVDIQKSIPSSKRGDKLRIKILLQTDASNPNPSIDSLGIYYR